MRPNTLKEKMLSGEPVVCGWLSIPSSYSAELVSAQGYDGVNIDLQHGMLGFDAALPMIQAVGLTDAIPIVRIGGNDPVTAMKMLDAGAYGIICPMVSTADDAARFVAACRYPPLGERSFGPARGLLYGGADYAARANEEILTIAMIETREGLDALDAIAAVDGLDALFVGPNDLALALGHGPASESDEPDVIEAVAAIREAASRACKPCGIFCSSAQAAKARIDEGFVMVVPGSDAGLLGAVCRDAVASVRAR